eukprot:3444914-Alexandrium_andersonii.AAC.1
MCVSRSLLRWHRPACAPTCAGACVAPGRHLPGGGALYTSVLERFGFVRGKASACCFYSAKIDVRRVVQGDDFTFTGYDDDLDAAERYVNEKFMCKVE